MSEIIAPFLEGLALGELRYQHCCVCSAAQRLDPLACRRCGSVDLEWRRSTGLGTVSATSLVHRAPSSDYRDLVPYRLVLVELEEGARLMAHGGPDLAIGDRVNAGFFTLAGKILIRFESEDGAP